MLKSKAYHMAMEAVVQYGYTAKDKVEILRILMKDEDIAAFAEENEISEAGAEVLKEAIG